MTLETHNWSSSAHQELHKIVKDENFPIVNQVDAKVQKFKIQFLKEAAKFVGDFKSLVKEADESLAKQRLWNWKLNALKTISLKRRMNMLNFGMIGVDNTKTRRPQPRSNTKNDKVLSTSKSSPSKNKRVEVEEDHRNLLLSKNTKHMSSACNNIMLDSQNVISKLVCAMCKQCLISVDHDVKKPKKVGFIERLATPKTSTPRSILRWSPTGRLFDQKGKIVNSSESESQFDYSNGDNACNSNTLEPKMKLFPNYTSFLGRQFSDSDLKVAFRRNTCFVRNLDEVDLLKGDHSTNLYTINLHEMASKFPICLMARASFTKSWLWHQRLSHLNFDTINDLARNDLVSGLPKFKYHKEHLCPSLLKEYFDSVGISHQMSSVRTPQQNGVVERRNRTLVKAARTMLIFSRAPLFLWAEAIATTCFTQNCSIIHRRFNKTPYELINSRKPDISFLHVFEALCYPKNDREDIRMLGAKGLDLTYAPSTITPQQLSEGKLDLLFEAMYDDYIGGQPLATVRTVLAAREPQVRQTSTASTSIADTAPTPPNSSSHATNIPITLQDVDKLNPNAMFDGNSLVNPFATSSISAAESSSSRNAKPTEKHLKEVKRIFRYLRGTINTGLWYMKDSDFELTGFSDADYAGCKDTFKSTSGGAQLLGEKLTQLTDYGFHFNKIPIYCDSKSAIAISCNPEHVEKGTIELYFVKTDYQLADLFTKALPVDRFNYLVFRLGSGDGVITSFQRSQDSRPHAQIILYIQDESTSTCIKVFRKISNVQALPQEEHY
nr:hypothetical protein [Tanacetum cinerariifolium]